MKQHTCTYIFHIDNAIAATISDLETRAEAYYLDWYNNYATNGKIAEKYGITETLSDTLIKIGREVNHTQRNIF